jgi:fucose 4-O-acetylase-like acetyltransferase
MEGTKRRAANSLGMFDLLKGVGMLTIVFAHTGELYPMGDASHINPLTFCMFAYRESLMAAFYIASGYGFRKRSIGKCIDQQFKTLLKPYIYTGIATTVFHFIIHYSLFGSLHNATYETYKVLGGFALGLPHTATYFGQLFFSCGPMWYLLSLMIGWVLLDAILNIFPEKYTHWAVLGIMLLGWGTTLVWELPFSLSQGAVIVPYLYIGYLAKKNRWLDKPLPRRTLYILLGGTALTAVGALLAQSTDCISMGEWTLGPLSILLDAATGFLFIRLFMRLNRFTGPIAQGLQAIGRNSLNIFCIHTVELIAIPWYLFAAHFTDHPLRGMLLQNVIAFTSIGLVCALLNLRRSWIVKASAARRQAQRRTPALSQHDSL